MSKRDYGSGSISQMQNGKWTARIDCGYGIDGKRKIKAFYGKTKSEVRKKLTEFKKEKEDYSQNNAYKMYISDYMMNWLETVKKVALKPTSYLKMNDGAYDALRALQKITGSYEYVVSTRNSKPTHPRSIDRTLRRILVRAGFPEDKIYGFRALRHTYASLMLKKGENIKIISENLGHSDITTTYNIYIHITEKMKAKAAKSMNLF